MASESLTPQNNDKMLFLYRKLSKKLVAQLVKHDDWSPPLPSPKTIFWSGFHQYHLKCLWPQSDLFLGFWTQSTNLRRHVYRCQIDLVAYNKKNIFAVWPHGSFFGANGWIITRLFNLLYVYMYICTKRYETKKIVRVYLGWWKINGSINTNWLGSVREAQPRGFVAICLRHLCTYTKLFFIHLNTGLLHIIWLLWTIHHIGFF